MAKKERKFRLYNRIGFLAISLVLVLVTVLGMGDSFLPTSLALEQEARCEMEEHVHTEECYIDSVLLCDKKAHTHSENCYLVLLKDNDINTLLTTVDADENDSLEGAIQSTLALAAEEESTSDGESDPAPSPTATATPTPTATATPEPTATPTPTPAISAQLLAASNTSTATTLALNENLYGVSTLALEDEVATAAEVAEIVPEDGYAGLYVWIADENKWECIGTLRMNFSFGEWAYSVSLSDINSTYRQVLGYAPGTGAGTYSYSTSVPSNNGSHTQITGSDAYMGRSYGPRYIYLEPGGTPTNFYRVTYDYLNQDDVAIYVRVNNTTTLPTLGTGYAWEHQGTMARIDGGTSVTVASSVTYKQVSKSVTVTWVYPDKTETDTQTPQGSSVSFDVPTLSGYASEYIWVDAANSKVTGSTVTLTADATYRAIPRYYTITYLSSGGAELYKDTVEYGASAALRTAPDSHFWVGEDGTVYLNTIEKVTENLTLTATTNVSAVFNYSDGTTQSVGPYLPGTKITLPTLTGTRVWEDEAGNTYAGGTEVTLTQNKIFTERVSLTLSYDVNFPTSGYDFYYDVTAPAASPTVYGATTSTASFPVAENSTATLRTVSTTIVRLETAHGKDFTYPVAFKGWESETGELISAHSRLSWNELLGYDKDGDGIVEMTGVWVDGRAEMANFFILHNAQVDQTTGNANDYTTSIYSTVVGNSNTTKNPLYTADDDATALENDADIRKMYGERSDGMWFYSFPTDEEIFEALKDHVDDLTVNGEKVSADKLNSNEYAIRWYQVAYDGGDGWHIDGKLTRKVGAIEVRKTFSGNETLIETAKENFSITATNAGGTKSHTLNASNAIDDGDGNPNTWYWRITGVEYNEAWTLTESANTDNSIHYAEWAVVDASVNSQTGNGTGASVTVTGVTYASDLANPEWLQVDFNNIYYHKDSLMIKKADGVTGEALSGAQFQLFQNGTRMTFDYNSSTGMYVYNPAGSGAYNTLTCDGYVNIAATGFTFDVHDISVVEIKAPTNYNPVGEIRVGYIDSTTIGITNGVDYATYHDGLLVVYNSTNTLNVTARKDWECEAAEWRDITVQLFANDSANLASTLTGSSSTVVTLTAANDYSYTWENLPIYAYGTKVEWSIKETQIGDEACKADYTFANWAVSYDAPAYDSDGNVTLMVHNTPSRPLLYLTKTNADGSYQLSGATFTLVQVNSSGVMVDGFVPRTGTTNEQGVLIFDNLLYGARYRISEDTPPSGYRPISEPIYVTIAEGGLVTVESHTHAKADAVAYNMVVTNDAYPPLPATGAGVVPGFYVRTGALLMAAALFLLAYEQRRRREAERPDA